MWVDSNLIPQFQKKLILLHLSISCENCVINGAISGFLHKDIKGKTCWFKLYFSFLADLWSSQLFLREDSFLPHRPKRAPNPPHPGYHGVHISVYLTKPFSAPSGLSAYWVLADLLLLLSETPITSNTFSTTVRPIMVK